MGGRTRFTKIHRVIFRVLWRFMDTDFLSHLRCQLHRGDKKFKIPEIPQSPLRLQHDMFYTFVFTKNSLVNTGEGCTTLIEWYFDIASPVAIHSVLTSTYISISSRQSTSLILNSNAFTSNHNQVCGDLEILDYTCRCALAFAVLSALLPMQWKSRTGWIK